MLSIEVDLFRGMAPILRNINIGSFYVLIGLLAFFGIFSFFAYFLFQAC